MIGGGFYITFNSLGNVNNNFSHVGSIIISTTLDTEAKVKALYGGVSWRLIKDRFLVGAGNSYSVNTIGGLSVNTLTADNLPSHSHSYNEPINHSHGLSSGYACISLWGDQNIYRAKDGSWVTTWHNGYNVGMQGRAYTFNATSGTALGGTTDSGGASQSASTGATGSGTAFSNIPPYKAVYIWERTK